MIQVTERPITKGSADETRETLIKEALINLDRQVGAKNPVSLGARNEVWSFQMIIPHDGRARPEGRILGPIRTEQGSFPAPALPIAGVEQPHRTHGALPCKKTAAVLTA